MAYVAQVWLVPSSLTYQYLQRNGPSRGKYPEENTVTYATKERAKVAVGINPRTKAHPRDTADQVLKTVMQAGPPGGKQLGEGQAEGGLPRRGVAYILEQPGVAPAFKKRCPLTARC